MADIITEHSGIIALGHLLTLGDLAGLMLFGALFACGISFLLLSWQRDVRPSPDWRAGHDLLSVLAGVALYGVTTQLHGIVAGVSVITLSRKEIFDVGPESVAAIDGA